MYVVFLHTCLQLYFLSFDDYHLMVVLWYIFTISIAFPLWCSFWPFVYIFFFFFLVQAMLTSGILVL